MGIGAVVAEVVEALGEGVAEVGETDPAHCRVMVCPGCCHSVQRRVTSLFHGMAGLSQLVHTPFNGIADGIHGASSRVTGSGGHEGLPDGAPSPVAGREDAVTSSFRLG